MCARAMGGDFTLFFFSRNNRECDAVSHSIDNYLIIVDLRWQKAEHTAATIKTHDVIF